jgi:hypothetical protein
MSVLSGIHFYFSFITCLILIGLGMIHYKPVNNYLHLLRIALGSLGSVIFMNYNLATNSIGFYQTSKLSCIPITLMIETILNKRQQNLSFKMVFSLFLILLGMGLVAVNEISFNIEGIHIYVHIHICIYSQIFYVHVYIYIYLCFYEYLSLSIHMYVYIFLCVHIYVCRYYMGYMCSDLFIMCTNILRTIAKRIKFKCVTNALLAITDHDLRYAIYKCIFVYIHTCMSIYVNIYV